MGYPSDVGLCLTLAGKQFLDAALSEAEKAHARFSEIRNLLKCAEVRTDADSGSVSYLWSEVKWYSIFEGTAFFEELLIELACKDYLFIRIGEASDDTEYWGGFWENPFGMCLTRGITFGR